jgi:hypothetical protein
MRDGSNIKHFTMGAATLAAALALCGALTGCQDEGLSALTAQIRIVDPDEPRMSLCAKDFVAECAHAFGDIDVGGVGIVTFVIENAGRAPLAIRSMAIEGSPHVTLDGEAPSHVEAGTSVAVTVRAIPVSAGPLSAHLVVVSDAVNQPPGGVVIELTANGIELGAPSISVEPAQCDFGSVAVGVRALCTVSIANNGQQPLNVEALATSGAPFELDAQVAPATVQPGTSMTVTVAATPASIGTFEGALSISSNAGSAEVALVVRGSQDPTAVARIKSVNGTPYAGGNVEPLDDVVLSGDQSVANIVGYAWTIVEKPVESSVTLSAPTSVDTGFVFDSSLGVTSGVDVAGTFRVRLTVTDASGVASTNDATVTLSSVPTGGVHVQMSWTIASNDLDLHLGRGFNVNWCSQSDCYYANCTVGSMPDWDGVGDNTPGDPRLDIDDTQGFGPENIQIEEPVDNSYIIGVHAYDGNGGGPGFSATDVRVKVFINGALSETFDGFLDAKDQFWRVARIEVSGGAVSINPVDTVSDHLTSCQ